MPEFAGVL